MKTKFKMMIINMIDVFFRTSPRIRNMEKFHLLVSENINQDREKIDELQKLRASDEKKIDELQIFAEYSPKKLELQQELKEIPEINYLGFENNFRGSEELIKERQTPYLSYFTNCKKVLDIGCGRGEFLELARDNNILAQGIDIDKDMYLYCKNKNLEIIHDDIFSFLLNIEDDYFDGIFSSQVIEHIDFLKLQQLIYLLGKKVKKGGKIILETVNPLCLLAFQHFYMDMTHIKPIFPDVLIFIGKSFNLKKVDLLFRTPTKEGLIDPQFTNERSYDYGDYALILEK